MPKTFWHLIEQKRMPSEYELVGSQLAYHPRFGSAVRTPVVDFHAQHACTWKVADWEAFHDPEATTYSSYVESRRERELFVDRLLRTCDDGSYDAALSPAWLSALDRVLSPLRYPCHGLQLAAAYVAAAAPAGRISVMAGFQAADELRRLSRLAYRTRQLMDASPSFAARAKADWQDAAHWQPLRELIEHLLVAYAWSEAFCALNLVVKPLFDALFGQELARIALAERDDVLGRMLESLHEDSRWHAEYAFGLARFVIASDEANTPSLRGFIERWQPRARKALLAAAAPLQAWCSTDALAETLDQAHARSVRLVSPTDAERRR
jgi:toluene monooxygenase system protein E